MNKAYSISNKNREQHPNQDDPDGMNYIAGDIYTNVMSLPLILHLVNRTNLHTTYLLDQALSINHIVMLLLKIVYRYGSVILKHISIIGQIVISLWCIQKEINVLAILTGSKKK